VARRPLGIITFARRALGHRDDPLLTPRPRLDSIQTAVDQDPGEPDFERQFFPKRRQVGIRLDERVLHGFVSFGAIAQIVVGDSRCPSLMPSYELGISLASACRPSACMALTADAAALSASRGGRLAG
jgi:hypothetical protein